MGAPKPWPTRWPDPPWRTEPDPEEPQEPGREPEFPPGTYPEEEPSPLPEETAPSLPWAVTWGVTDPCNLRCSHCYDATGSHRSELSSADAREAIDRLTAAGFRFVVFSGGEPLLRRDLFELIHRCRERGLATALRSNGTLVRGNVAERLAELGVAVVGVSLDGGTEATHDAVRGRGAFRSTLRGIQALVAAGLRVNVEVVLSRQNAAEYGEMIRLAERLGVQEVNFSALTTQGRGRDLAHHLLDHDLWRHLTGELHQASRTARVAVSPNCVLTGACVGCIEPHLTCDGWVTSCYLSAQKLFHLLRTPPSEVRERLRQARPDSLDVCGRRQWVSPDAAKATLLSLPVLSSAC